MLINFVGCDGSGKTTQLQLVKGWIHEQFDCRVRVSSKSDVVRLEHFPEHRIFSSSYQELAHEIVPQMKSQSRALFLFYLVAAATCRCPPRDDEVLLVDGYWQKIFATEAALGLDSAWLRQVCSFFPEPDVTILLDVEPERIVGRCPEPNPYECGCSFDCTESSFIENQRKVYTILRETACSDNWIVVDARRSKTAIFDEIKLLLHDRIARIDHAAYERSAETV